ncbi:putative MSHA biogenesis protein MshN [Simiduia agarivorans SA1 = DSM 21679]|uniref:MSHA biogenesis protein MshN n=2 Tax=Simiduia TaxID=447467 RepID=K4KGE7_SIMAS|nr:putative MSHA biogenesis protein MshN [Simiduia agarivorans SA1 = DSM 21679]
MDTAALTALQQSERTVQSQYVAPIELSYRGRGRFWLSVFSLLVFCLGFAGHQFFLQLTSAPVVAQAPVPNESHQAHSEKVLAMGSSPTQEVKVVAESQRTQTSTGAKRTLVDTSESNTPSQEPSVVIGQAEPAPSTVEVNSQELQPDVKSNDQQTLMQMQLALLQRNAAAALERDRLLTPAHDNAVFYYQSMLALDKANVVAEDGLRAVAARYIELSETLLARGDDAAAADMLAKAEQVYPGSSALLATPAAGRTPVRLARSTEVVARNSPAAVQRAPAVTLSAASQRAQLLNQVLSLSQRGQHQAVVALLEPQADNDKTDVALLSALHAAYLATGNADKAQALAQRAGMPSHVASLMRAQQSVANNDYASAIGELEMAPPAPSDNPEYFTLLAGLYYETGRHQDSQYLYRELLKQDTRNGRWWLGYAVASDALNHTDTLMAYQGALKYLLKTDSARQYAEQRVSQLSGKQGLN